MFSSSNYSISIYLKLCSTYSIIYVHMNVESVDGGHVLVSVLYALIVSALVLGR